jgi:hypothetical protein
MPEEYVVGEITPPQEGADAVAPGADAVGDAPAADAGADAPPADLGTAPSADVGAEAPPADPGNDAPPADTGDPVPPPPVPAALWAGDFECGDLSQWTREQQAAADRIAVIASPVHQGSRAAKFTVRYGDLHSNGERAEVLYNPTGGEAREGEERWYKWWTMFDASYPSHPAWQLFTQWHHSGSSGSPPVEFLVNGEEIRFSTRECGSCTATVRVLDATLDRGVWHEFILHVKWSSDAAVGFVEVWYDGSLAVPRTNVTTLYPGQTNYLKQGLYRKANTIAADGIVYHDGMIKSATPLSPGPAAGALASLP